MDIRPGQELRRRWRFRGVAVGDSVARQLGMALIRHFESCCSFFQHASLVTWTYVTPIIGTRDPDTCAMPSES